MSNPDASSSPADATASDIIAEEQDLPLAEDQDLLEDDLEDVRSLSSGVASALGALSLGSVNTLMTRASPYPDGHALQHGPEASHPELVKHTLRHGFRVYRLASSGIGVHGGWAFLAYVKPEEFPKVFSKQAESIDGGNDGAEEAIGTDRGEQQEDIVAIASKAEPPHDETGVIVISDPEPATSSTRTSNLQPAVINDSPTLSATDEDPPAIQSVLPNKRVFDPLWHVVVCPPVLEDGSLPATERAAAKRVAQKPVSCHFLGSQCAVSHEEWRSRVDALTETLIDDDPDELDSLIKQSLPVFKAWYEEGGSADSAKNRQPMKVHVGGSKKQTLLLVFVERNWPRCVALLLERYWADGFREVRPWERLAQPLMEGDRWGNTAVHVACYCGNAEVLRVILAALGRYKKERLVDRLRRIGEDLRNQAQRDRPGELAVETARKRGNAECEAILQRALDSGSVEPVENIGGTAPTVASSDADAAATGNGMAREIEEIAWRLVFTRLGRVCNLDAKEAPEPDKNWRALYDTGGRISGVEVCDVLLTSASSVFNDDTLVVNMKPGRRLILKISRCRLSAACFEHIVRWYHSRAGSSSGYEIIELRLNAVLVDGDVVSDETRELFLQYCYRSVSRAKSSQSHQRPMIWFSIATDTLRSFLGLKCAYVKAFCDQLTLFFGRGRKQWAEREFLATRHVSKWHGGRYTVSAVENPFLAGLGLGAFQYAFDSWQALFSSTSASRGSGARDVLPASVRRRYNEIIGAFLPIFECCMTKSLSNFVDVALVVVLMQHRLDVRSPMERGSIVYMVAQLCQRLPPTKKLPLTVNYLTNKGWNALGLEGGEGDVPGRNGSGGR